MKLYLVRHGQLAKNEINSFDKDLDEIGIEQAKRVGRSFQKILFTKVFCSKLKRTNQTLKEILPHINIKAETVIYTEKLNEVSRGIYKTRKEYEKDLLSSGLREHNFRPDSGENFYDTQERANKFIEELKNNSDNEKILIIGHGIYFRLLLLGLLKLHMSQLAYFELHPASITYIEFDNKKVITDIRLNSCEHLLKCLE